MTRKKTRLLRLLLLLTLGLAGAFLVLRLWLTAPSYPIDLAGYEGIHKGMSKAGVETHLGVRSGYYAQKGNFSLMPLDGDVDQSKRTVGWWFGNQYAILVEYDDKDRVRAKALYRVFWIDPGTNWLLDIGHRVGLW